MLQEIYQEGDHAALNQLLNISFLYKERVDVKNAFIVLQSHQRSDNIENTLHSLLVTDLFIGEELNIEEHRTTERAPMGEICELVFYKLE